MISIIQRVSSASVSVNKKKVAKIDQGILALVCIERVDDVISFAKLTDKILKYRIFEDDDQKMNLSVQDIKGDVILVPQFTLATDTSKGNRPSFSGGCQPHIAEIKFNDFFKFFKSKYEKVQSGVFGADMQVAMVNDGLVTFTFKVQ
jgi:D-tyrosyl-tRNA(Tyr) deacylase